MHVAPQISLPQNAKNTSGLQMPQTTTYTAADCLNAAEMLKSYELDGTDGYGLDL